MPYLCDVFIFSITKSKRSTVLDLPSVTNVMNNDGVMKFN